MLLHAWELVLPLVEQVVVAAVILRAARHVPLDERIRLAAQVAQQRPKPPSPLPKPLMPQLKREGRRLVQP